jgi:hypothetical protein
VTILGAPPVNAASLKAADEEEPRWQSHPNAVIARQMTAILSRGDMQALEGFIVDDAIWHEIGGSEPRESGAQGGSTRRRGGGLRVHRHAATPSSPTTTRP